jgi:hypothetical protein
VTLPISKKLYTLFILCTVIACAIRWFFFEKFGTFSNDDASYVGMAKHIFTSLPTVDGSSPHTLFPPGYPLILAIENLIFKSFYEARKFEYIFLTATIPFIILAFFKPLDIKVSLPHLSILFFTPFFLFFTATLGGATEIWFTIFTLCGTYSILNFHLSQRIFFLFLGNCLFSFAYLIRPEGLAYFISSVVAIFFFLKSSRFVANRKVIAKILLSLLLPIFALIVPYVLFLYDATGQLTISGKSAFNQELVDSIYSTQNEKLIANIAGLARVLVAPFFLGPIILSLLVAFCAGLILRYLPFQKNYIFLITPIPIIFLAMITFLPWARALVSTVPIFIIFAVKGLDFLNSKFNSKLSPLILFGLLTITQFGITFTPIALGKFDNIPKQYYELAAVVEVPSKPLLVFSRDGTLQLFKQNVEVCRQLEKCQKGLDYAFLSNSTHDKLSGISNIENQESPPRYFRYPNNQCSLISSNKSGQTWFAAYRCQN